MAENLSLDTIQKVESLQVIVDALYPILGSDTLGETLDAVVAGIRKVVGEQATAAIGLTDQAGNLAIDTYRVDGPRADVMRRRTAAPGRRYWNLGCQE